MKYLGEHPLDQLHWVIGNVIVAGGSGTPEPPNVPRVMATAEVCDGGLHPLAIAFESFNALTKRVLKPAAHCGGIGQYLCASDE